jgi:GTP-binding protein
MVSDRRGVSTTEALMSLGERGSLLIGPGTEVYEGMVIGENARADEMDVNPTREKKQSNMRSSTSDVLISLSPHLQFSLEQSLDFIGEDECAEVTPKSVRLRKLILEQALRARQRRRGNRDPGT